MKSLQLKDVLATEHSPGIWRIEPRGAMRVGVHLVGSEQLLKRVAEDKSISQAMNVATLPGVVDPVLTMPDIHQGYGFPIGGVAAFHPDTGVVSPGGVGYDINCGIRLLKTELRKEDIHERATMRSLVSELFDKVPCGVGSKRTDLPINEGELKTILAEGASWAVSRGFGESGDLEASEERARILGANVDNVSTRAIERGLNQLGTLGSGNHFLEVQFVDEIYDQRAADAFGLFQNQVVVSIHTGSRGLGYQVCEDYIERCLEAAKRYMIRLPDRELAAAPIDSDEGQAYLGAMACAANFAFTNRQMISHWVREVFRKQFGIRSMPLLYDVCHNIAKFEELSVGRHSMRLCIHRKGATRAYPPNHPKVPLKYQAFGQPILIPGDMGRYSYVLRGDENSLKLTFGSACHGAGRELSRSQAKKRGKGRALVRELEDKGIYVKSAGRDTLLEEMPEAYKDVAEVVAATADAGIAALVARLRPMGVVKG